MAFNNSHGIQLVNETTYHLMKHRQDICVEQVLECKNAVNELERELLCQKANNCKLFNPLKGKNISGTDISKPVSYDTCFALPRMTFFTPMYSSHTLLCTTEAWKL